MYVLDTNVLSEFRKESTGRIDANVKAWASRVSESRMFLAAVTILEVEVGVLQMERRDRQQGALLRGWFELHVLSSFAGRILPFDVQAAHHRARMHVPNPHSQRDAMIAATALVHGMTVVTRNVEDFRSTGVSVFNPWEA